MDSIHLLSMYESDRNNMLMAVLQSLKDRLAVPGSFLAFQGYTPSFNDGSPCTHTWTYVGFGPGWVDRDCYITEDNELLDRWNDRHQLEKIGASEVFERTEADNALVTLIDIFWADIGQLIRRERNSGQKNTIEATSSIFRSTDCEGAFYLKENGALCFEQYDYFSE